MMGFPFFWLWEGQIMKEIRMCVETDIELHTITSFLFNSLREKEMFYVYDSRRFADNMLSYYLYQNRRVSHEKKIIVHDSYPGYDF